MKRILLKAAIAFALLTLVSRLASGLASPDCFGWECQTVRCPDDYAVRLPDSTYLRCEDFESFVDGKGVRLLAPARSARFISSVKQGGGK